MLNAIGIISTGSALAVLIVAVTSSVTVHIERRTALAAIGGAWIGLAVAVTASGPLALRTVLALFSLPLIAGALAAALPAARSAMLAIPVPLIIGLNVIRALGVFFLVLASAGRLSGPFPYSAGIGDIITAAFAIPVARIAARSSVTDVRVVAWNAFGILDLIVAVALGITSQNGSPLQLIHAGVGSAAIATLPWSLVPLVLVPLFLIGHSIVFALVRLQLCERNVRREQLAAT
jgi:hypothetical protein